MLRRFLPRALREKLLGAHLGGNNRAWAHAVARSGLDYVEAFTPSPDTDMGLSDALAAWPGKVLWENFSSSVHLAGEAGGGCCASPRP